MTTFTITAGHDEKRPGAVAKDGTTEASVVTVLRDVVASKLRKLGHTVYTDGGWRRNLPLPLAMRLVPKAELALEFHMNASTSSSAVGVESISLPDKKAIACAISRSIAHVLESPIRGAGGWIDQSQSARGRLGFVRVGGIIVEVGFISNAEELHRVQSRMWPMATAIVKVITGEQLCLTKTLLTS